MLLRQTGLLGGICFRYCAYKADKAGYDKIPQKRYVGNVRGRHQQGYRQNRI